MKNSEKFYFFLYFILNFFCYIIVLISLNISTIKFTISFHFIQIISSTLSLLFLYKTRNHPGYIQKDKSLIKEEELKETNDETKDEIEEEIKEEIKEERKEETKNEMKEEMKEEIKEETNIETKNESIVESKNEISLNISSETSPILILNLMPHNGCDICKIEKLPLRSQHCEKCDKCVRGFDHHSWILAGCIGENNRLTFILFLVFQFISIIYSAYSVLKLLNNNDDNESLIYFFTFLFSIMCLFGIIFFWIFIYHFYLLITNQTTYEIFNDSECPYLSIFVFERNKILAQRGIVVEFNAKLRPFDIGIINNIYIYLIKMFNKDNEIRWEEIYYENLKTTNLSLACCDKLIQN